MLVALVALANAAGVPLPAQNSAPREQKVSERCPTLSVSCPDNVTPGTPATFTVNVSGGDSKVNPTYRWTVSAGTIISGQETSSITVDTTGPPSAAQQYLTATVDVGGYPSDCPDSASCTSDVIRIIDYFPTDEYGNLRWSDEKARLDNFAIELQSGAGMDGHIICYGGRRGRRGEARARCARAKDYLVTRRKIPAERVVTVDGGYREELTVTLWPLPQGVQFTASPTVDPSEVEFTDAPKKRRPRPGSKRD
jgi:hypothetical protein